MFQLFYTYNFFVKERFAKKKKSWTSLCPWSKRLILDAPTRYHRRGRTDIVGSNRRLDPNTDIERNQRGQILTGKIVEIVKNEKNVKLTEIQRIPVVYTFTKGENVWNSYRRETQWFAIRDRPPPPG